MCGRFSTYLSEAISTPICDDLLNIIHAPEKGKAALREGTGWGGSIIGSEAGMHLGAEVGGAIGVWFGGAGFAPSAAFGGFIGGIAGGIGGYVWGYNGMAHVLPDYNNSHFHFGGGSFGGGGASSWW